MILIVMIFVFGGALAVYKKVNKPKVSSVETTVSEIPGWWLQKYFGTSACEKDDCRSEADPDQDKLTNVQEHFYHTDPFNKHTVGDDLTDGELVAAGFDPSRSGKMTFEEVVEPENLLKESLVFGEDIQEIIGEDLDINQIDLPLVKDDELRITYTETEATYKTYAAKLKSTITKYFREQDVGSIAEVLKSGSDAEAADIALSSARLAEELKTIEIPFKLLMFHKYNIVMFQLLSEIVPIPQDFSGPNSDIWFEKVQAFLAVQQKLGFEQQSLSR